MISPSRQALLGFIIVIAVVAGAVGSILYVSSRNPAEPRPLVRPADIATLTVAAPVTAESFATYEEPAVLVTPAVKSYVLDAGLNSVSNLVDFTTPDSPGQPPLSQSQQALIAKNGFVVSTADTQSSGGLMYGDEFFPIYEGNRYAYLPNFITTDSLLHSYHLLFDHLLKEVEEEKLSPALSQLTERMSELSETERQAVKGTVWENAARRNVAFFAVASRLLDPDAPIPASVKSAVEQELALIAAHESVRDSVVMNFGQEPDQVIDTPQGPLTLSFLKEDYSQYVPRGHYTKSDELKRYFNAMMWYGRMTFRVKYPDEVRSAVLITLALNDAQAAEHWQAIYEPTNFFVGKSDDITVTQLSTLIREVYGDKAKIDQLAEDRASFDALIEKTRGLEPPAINSIPVFQASIQSDREAEILGFRFMGQRFTVDASIFQRLLCREVGNKHGTMDCGGTIPDSRMLPKGLDIPAAMGSAGALDLLTAMGETTFKNYPENLQKLRDHLSGLNRTTWTQNLYWGWLYTLKPLTEERGEGYPTFMRNQAWARKNLQTYLGSWTELKHDTILYTKQSYAELGGGPPDERDDRGYVEPEPHVFARLSALSKLTKEGLQQRGLLTTTGQQGLERMEQLALSLKTIAEKELANQPLSADDYTLIRTYGGDLEHFWTDVNKEEYEPKQETMQDYLRDNPAALVADVATDPNGSVLEEAIGKVSVIYVVVPIDGKLRLTKGGVYSYYEFVQPISERLTDQAWRELLDSPDAPAQPGWTDAFTSS